METNSDSPITAIASERGPSSVLLASFADGVIKVFDRRLEEEDAVVRSFNEHTSWVQNVRWQPHFGNQFLSGRSVSAFVTAFWTASELLFYCFSMNGEAKLWDIRGSDRAVETWDVFPGGLAAFDVHEQCGVFAGYELSRTFPYVMMLTKLFRLSALSSSNWRTQRAVVHSIPHPNILSSVSMNTGLTTSPTRGFPSQFIPRSGSVVFHPTEMLYGVGSPDGTGTCPILYKEKIHLDGYHQCASTAPT